MARLQRLTDHARGVLMGDRRVYVREWSVCTRDIWKKQLDRLSAKLEAVTQYSATIDAESSRLARDVESFVAASTADGSFDNRAVVSTARSSGDLLRDMTALHQLEVQLACLIQLSDMGSSIQLALRSRVHVT